MIHFSSRLHEAIRFVSAFKGVFLDFSHLTELENIYIHVSLKFILINNTNLQKLRIIKLMKTIFDGCSLKRLRRPPKLFSDFVPEMEKSIVGKSSD